MTAIGDDVLALVAAMAPAGGTPHLNSALIGDLGYSSLRLLELSIAAERAFALPPFAPEALLGVATVGDLVELILTQRDRS